MLKHLDLFSGIGGFSLGLESAGLVQTVAFCDFDKYCQQILKKNFPDVHIYGDVKELNYDKLKTDGIDTIDIITGGYPCQPFSVAGSKKGEQDPRHVWPEMFRLIKECRPTWVIGENVGGHIKLGLDTVLENLESEGYSARTFSISASSVGANHKRERVWVVANSRRSSGREQSPGDKESFGLWSFETPEWSTNTNQTTGSSERAETMANTESQGGREPGHFNKEKRNKESSATQSQSSSSDVANTTGDRWNESQSNKISRSTVRESQEGGMLQSERTSNVSNSNSKRRRLWETGIEDAEDVGQSSRGEETLGWWDVEPDVGRVAHGVPKRVDRLKCLGNSVVPQIPFLIGLAIKETIENE